MRLWPFLYKGRIIRLDELGQTFVVCLFMRLRCKDGHKTHYAAVWLNFPSKYILNDALRKGVRRDA